MSIAIVWMLLFPHNLYVEILMLNVMILGGGVLGKYLGHESGTLINEVSTFIKEASEIFLPSTMGGHNKKSAT